MTHGKYGELCYTTSISLRWAHGYGTGRPSRPAAEQGHAFGMAPSAPIASLSCSHDGGIDDILAIPRHTRTSRRSGRRSSGCPLGRRARASARICLLGCTPHRGRAGFLARSFKGQRQILLAHRKPRVVLRRCRKVRARALPIRGRGRLYGVTGSAPKGAALQRSEFNFEESSGIGCNSKRRSKSNYGSLDRN
jgi:hypothetical protein